MDVEEFIDREFDALARYAGVLAGDRDLAQDVLADAFVYLIRHWRRIRSMEYPQAYARRVVASSFLQIVRRREPVPVGGGTDDDAERIATADPADAFERIDDRDYLDSLLRQLPPAQLTAVVMRYYLDSSTPDIAAALGCSEQSARAQLSRARRALRLLDAAASTDTP